MSMDLHTVTTTIPFMPEYNAAKSKCPEMTTLQRVRWVEKQIRRQVKERFSSFDGHESQPRYVDMYDMDIPADLITVIVKFDDPQAAVLWKLTHGGAA